MALPPTHLGPSFLPSLTTSNPTLSSTDGPSLQICPLHLPHWQQRNPSQNPQWFHSSSWAATSNCHCISPKSLPPCPATSSHHSWHPASLTASLSSLGPSYMFYLLPGIFSHLQSLLHTFTWSTPADPSDHMLNATFSGDSPGLLILTSFSVDIPAPWSYTLRGLVTPHSTQHLPPTQAGAATVLLDPRVQDRASSYHMATATKHPTAQGRMQPK